MSHIRYGITNWCFGNETLVAKSLKLSDIFLSLTFNLHRKENVINVVKTNNLLSIKQYTKLKLACLCLNTIKKFFLRLLKIFLHLNLLT